MKFNKWWIIGLLMLLVTLNSGFALDLNISLIPDSPFQYTEVGSVFESYTGWISYIYFEGSGNALENLTGETSGERAGITMVGVIGDYYNMTIRFNTTFDMGMYDSKIFQIAISNQSSGTWHNFIYAIGLNGVDTDCQGSSITNQDFTQNRHFINVTFLGTETCNNTLFNEIRYQYQMGSTQWRTFDYIIIPDVTEYIPPPPLNTTEIFNETFGTSGFNYNVSNCYDDGTGGFSLPSHYNLADDLVFDNTWKCSMTESSGEWGYNGSSSTSWIKTPMGNKIQGGSSVGGSCSLGSVCFSGLTYKFETPITLNENTEFKYTCRFDDDVFQPGTCLAFLDEDFDTVIGLSLHAGCTEGIYGGQFPYNLSQYYCQWSDLECDEFKRTRTFTGQDLADNCYSIAGSGWNDSTKTDIKYVALITNSQTASQSLQGDMYLYFDDFSITFLNVTEEPEPTPPNPNIILNETWGDDYFNLQSCTSSTAQDYNCRYGSGDARAVECWNLTLPYDYITSSCSILADNIWHGLNSHTITQGNIQNESIASKVNTVMGARLYPRGKLSSCVAPSNCRFGFAYTPPTPFKFDENSSISMSCSGFIEPDGYNAVWFLHFNFENDISDTPFDGISFQLSESESGGDPVRHAGHPPNVCSVWQNWSNACTSSTAQNITLTYEYIQDKCTNLNATLLANLGTYDIDMIEFRTMYNFDNYVGSVIDDILIIAEQTTQPYIIFFDPIPNPQTENETVTWSASIGDDGSQSQIWTAMDCENDGVLDYGWLMGRSPTAFECTYGFNGIYTGRLWYSDNDNYPINYTTTNTVTILDEDTPAQGTNCIGFIEPSCPEYGTCWFYDDFNYAYKIECNGWEGNGDVELYLPQSNYFRIIDFDWFENSMIYEGDRTTIYDTMTLTLDFWIANPSAFYVHLKDGDTAKNSMVFQVANYVAFGLDYGGLENLGGINYSQWYELRAEIDFEEQKVYYYINDDYKGETEFYDLDVEGFSELKITFDEDGQYRIDNIRLTYGTVEEGATEPEEEEVEYVFNSDFVCAINWTADTGNRFSEQNCIDRGFSVEYPLIGICPLRACFQDLGLVMVAWALRNIFTTLIVVTGFILIAPLLIGLARRR